MAVLKRLDYLIKKTSSNEIATQLNAVVTNLNEKQENASNKISGGAYKNEFYATLFDPRDNKEYLAFSNKTKETFALSENTLLLTPNVLSGSGVDSDSLKEIIIRELETKGLLKINDTATETTSVWSSSKVNEKLTEITNTQTEKLRELNSEFALSGVSIEFLASL